ncbi:hypothetical protein QR680_006620 [Steinernema hermaphroditum]|uniref:CTP synthase n=1 Tax=Steinernema hermaphroditum TaxID=289476 RepID=A0AA39HYH8_9BILA|nr:hypothetical protein QR680_006620 [Steinernema hermaphroditum]
MKFTSVTKAFSKKPKDTPRPSTSRTSTERTSTEETQPKLFRRNAFLKRTITKRGYAFRSWRSLNYRFTDITVPTDTIFHLGGTIGDAEGSPFYKAFDIYKRPTHRDQLMSVHVSLVLDPKATDEAKTKPLQNSLKLLHNEGLNSDLSVCRSEKPLTPRLKEKISEVSMLDLEQIVGVHDVSNIYKVLLPLYEQNVLEQIVKQLNLRPVDPSETLRSIPSLQQWTQLSELCEQPTNVCRIALVGKYVRIEDAYASVNKAVRCAAIRVNRKLVIEYVSSEDLEDSAAPDLRQKAWEAVSGIVVPGSFGYPGIEGMIRACQYARESKVPYLGICLGMQCAAIEFARNSKQIVIDMPEHCAATHGLGATMRLGRRTTVFLTDDSKLRHLYGRGAVEERHRHRYEVNPKIVPELSRAGRLLFIGMGVDDDDRSRPPHGLPNFGSDALLRKIEQLCERGGDGREKTAVRMEMIEMKDHPYFMGVQFHPEYLSHPLKPSPPFVGLLLASSNQLASCMHGTCPTPMGILTASQKGQS